MHLRYFLQIIRLGCLMNRRDRSALYIRSLNLHTSPVGKYFVYFTVTRVLASMPNLCSCLVWVGDTEV
jgi:hypothetical protein